MPVASCLERSRRPHNPAPPPAAPPAPRAGTPSARPAESSPASSFRQLPSRWRVARPTPERSRQSNRRCETPRPRSRDHWARQTERIRPRTTRIAASNRVPCAADGGAAARSVRSVACRDSARRASSEALRSSAQAFSASSAGPSRGSVCGTIVSFEVYRGGRDGHECLLTGMPMATAMPIRRLAKSHRFLGAFRPDPDARVAVATVAVKKPGQQRPAARVTVSAATASERPGGNLPPAHPAFPADYLPLLLELLCAAGFAVLLDCRLRQILVLRADHSENRSGAVAATRNRTKLNRTFAPLANDDAAANADRSRVRRARSSRFARARNDFRLDDRRQFVHELLNDFLKIRTSCHLISPCYGGRRLAANFALAMLDSRIQRVRNRDSMTLVSSCSLALRSVCSGEFITTCGLDSRAIRNGPRHGARCSAWFFVARRGRHARGCDPCARTSAHRRLDKLPSGRHTSGWGSCSCCSPRCLATDVGRLLVGDRAAHHERTVALTRNDARSLPG